MAELAVFVSTLESLGRPDGRPCVLQGLMLTYTLLGYDVGIWLTVEGHLLAMFYVYFGPDRECMQYRVYTFLHQNIYD